MQGLAVLGVGGRGYGVEGFCQLYLNFTRLLVKELVQA